MVKTTYALTDEQAEKLASYASRYRSIRTTIDEKDGTMTIWTSFADNAEPTSIADKFQLEVLSEEPPTMPEAEYRRRVEGKPF